MQDEVDTVECCLGELGSGGDVVIPKEDRDLYFSDGHFGARSFNIQHVLGVCPVVAVVRHDGVCQLRDAASGSDSKENHGQEGEIFLIEW